MKKWFKTNKLVLLGAILGSIIGLIYWNTIGCASGTCSITSKPLNSSIYFALLGAMVFSLFKKEASQNVNKQ